MHHRNMEHTMTNAATNAATLILESLATAFGGWSQFPDATVGQAVFGHFNNGGNATAGGVTPDEVMDAAATAIAERWEDCGVEFAPTRAAIQGGFDAARAAIGGRA
jgi:hypothetical protein